MSEVHDKILTEEKEKALGMVKVAAFNGHVQEPYPSPFLNLSDTQIPETANEIFKWCKYFYMFDPLISGAINSLSSFPVTSIYLEDYNAKGEDDEEDSEILKDYERILFKTLNIHKLLIEIGIDYHLYGNCFIFGEMHNNPFSGEKEWKNMVRLDPSKMIIDHNPATQEKKYKWHVPENIARICRDKKPKSEYEKIPDVIKKAVKEKKAVVLNNNNIFHFSRATDSMGTNNVWGTPMIANVLKLLMYRNVLRQAQEAIAREHIVPMRVYYLQRTEDFAPETDWNSVASNFAAELMKSTKDPNYKVVSPVPVNMINVGGQGRALLLTPEIQQIQEEVLAGMGVPREFIFGGVSFSSSSISLKILENQFITYRLLLIDFLQNFVIKRMAQARKEWLNEGDDDKLVNVKMTDLKMQDDVQQKSLIVQLNGAGKVTDEYMWQVLGLDSEKMRKSLQREMLAAAEAESEMNIHRMQLQQKEIEQQLKLQKMQIAMQAEMQVYQQLAQKEAMQKYVEVAGELPMDQMQEQGMQGQEQGQEMQAQEQGQEMQAQEQGQEMQGQGQPQGQAPEQVPEQGQVAPAPEIADPDIELRNMAMQIMKLPKQYREKALSSFPQHTQQKIKEMIMQLESVQGTSEKTEIDMRPMPEVLPPRRDSLK